MKPLQLYRVAFSHATPLHLMARNPAHAISTAKELCPDAQFLSATLMPEWDNTDETRCLAAQSASVH
jgi:hypothetical protein